MQEDVENKTVNLAIRTTKVTAQILYKGLKMFYNHHKNKQAQKAAKKNEPVRGEQSIKELVGQGQGVSSMPIGDKGVRDFKKICKKYGVDFAIVKDKNEDPPIYTVFFKAKDADAIASVLKEYSAKQMKSGKRKSVQVSWRSLRSLRILLQSSLRRKRKDERSTSDENKEHQEAPNIECPLYSDRSFCYKFG